MEQFNVRRWVFEDAETGERREIGIGAVTSVPRLAFTAHWSELQKAFEGLNIPVLKTTGYSWGACLQRGLNLMIEAGCDYIITIDYDSIFSRDDVVGLLTLAARYPDADAIFPWQVKRGGTDHLLIGLRDENGKPLPSAPHSLFQSELVQVASGHFGLTLLKTEALLKTPKPWFWEQPNAEGEWGDGKEDADMYFWRKFAESGHKACLASNVRIGHVDEHILWPSEEFQVIRQSVVDFYKSGKPDMSRAAPVVANGSNGAGYADFVKSVNLYNHTSQHGEDSLLEAIFARIGTANKWCMECGAGDGLFFSNTHKLISEGWEAVLIEGRGDAYEKLRQRYGQNEKVHCVNQMVGSLPGGRLDDILTRIGAPQDLDLMVIDVDGQDYHLWNSVINYRPRVVVIEFRPDVETNFIPEPGGQGQAGYAATRQLAWGKYYTTVCRTPVNLICVTNELAPLLVNSDIEGVRLNLGAGSVPLPGYVNLDIKTCHEIYPLRNHADGSVDEVRASHVLEHFPHREIASVVKEWARVLKPGGRLKVAVPDFDWIVKAYSNGQRNDWKLEGYLFGGQVDADDYHKALFNEDKLRRVLTEAGLVDVKRWEADAQDCSAYQVSLNLQGTKKETTCHSKTWGNPA